MRPNSGSGARSTRSSGILLRESLNQPLMVIFEDLHWIDDETQALLNLIADSIGTAHILLLVNYRPEYTHQWNSKTYYTQLRLDPLGDEIARRNARVLARRQCRSCGPLKRLIIDSTEGNPFFMEETVQALLDDRALVRNGSIKLIKPIAELKIPPTVQAILASRIDRLPPTAKDLLQTSRLLERRFRCGSRRKSPQSRAGPDARRPPDGRVHLRAARGRRHRVHLQARADPASRVQRDAE